jgi:hypothetical protein
VPPSFGGANGASMMRSSMPSAVVITPSLRPARPKSRRSFDGEMPGTFGPLGRFSEAGIDWWNRRGARGRETCPLSVEGSRAATLHRERPRLPGGEDLRPPITTPPAPGAERCASGLLFNDYALAPTGLCECHFTTGRQSRLKNCFPISQLIESFQLRQHSPCSSTWTGTDELTPLCQKVPPLGVHYCDKQFFIISLFRIVLV